MRAFALAAGVLLVVCASVPADEAQPPAKQPWVSVDILDESEGWFTTAELYLAVTTNRISDERVLIPVNIGPHSGRRSMFVELPFYVQPRDTIVFELLDEDEITDEEAEAILAGTRIVLTAQGIFSGSPKGKAIAAAGKMMLDQFGPELKLVSKATMTGFDHLGRAKYVVPKEIPAVPQDANPLTIREGTHARAEIRIYKNQ